MTKATTAPLWKNNFISQLAISYTFLISGIIVTSIQLLTYIFIWPFNRIVYRRVNNYLAYALWSNLTSLAQWWSGTELEMFVDDLKDLEMVGKENTLVVMNHKYDIDWLMGWVLCQRVGILGGCKVVMKGNLKYVPVMGLSWLFNEYIFLKRVWEEDQKILQRELATMFDYPKELFFAICVFCEGTRFNEQKHAASMEVATEKGLPLLKHHLLPRTKGFYLVASQVKDKVNYVLDLNLGVKKLSEGRVPGLMDLKNGTPVKTQIYMRRISMSEAHPEDEKKCASFIQKLYKEKDDIHDVFDKHGDFASLGAHRVVQPTNKYDLYISLAWLAVVLIPSVYYLLIIFWNGTLMFKFCSTGFVYASFLAVNYIITSSDSKHASSFGLKKKAE